MSKGGKSAVGRRRMDEGNRYVLLMLIDHTHLKAIHTQHICRRSATKIGLTDSKE